MTDMIVPQPKDAAHKVWLYRALIAISSNSVLNSTLAFKGGTCAAMLGYLDRFSIDLDFDFIGESQALVDTRTRLELIFRELGLVIHDQSKVVPQYFLKYAAPEGSRNTLKIDVSIAPPKANRYEPKRFGEIDRIITCQTIETMVANKLVALMDRYQHSEAIAGRDLYDIHSFLMKGYRYDPAVILERTGLELPQFFAKLITFIQQQVTEKLINQDLNTLLPAAQFSRVRKLLKPETLRLLLDEQQRMNVI